MSFSRRPSPGVRYSEPRGSARKLPPRSLPFCRPFLQYRFPKTRTFRGRPCAPLPHEVFCVAIVQVQELIEAGVHFGHRASRWNPKMRPYIYGKRNLIHIIDLRETVRGLLRAYRFLAQVASRGSLVLFVGTKRQAKEAIEREAARCGMPFVSERWLGGCLTNYRTIRDRLKRLQELEQLWLPSGEDPRRIDVPGYMRGMINESGKLDLTRAPESAPIHGYSKKMVSMLNRELSKIRRNLSG